MLKVLEYDEAVDGGFIVWIEDGPPHRSWFAHHMITGQWKVTTPEGADAYQFLSADAVGGLIELAMAKEEQAGWKIQYQGPPLQPEPGAGGPQ